LQGGSGRSWGCSGWRGVVWGLRDLGRGIQWQDENVHLVFTLANRQKPAGWGKMVGTAMDCGMTKRNGAGTKDREA
jgi:hypothetical protein